jgi:hypothetical protein
MNFGEKDCYPHRRDDRAETLRSINLQSEVEREGRKPSFLKLQRKCAMTDWGHGGGGGRRGRERGG